MRSPSPRRAFLLPFVLLVAVVAGCTSDDERILRLEEELATIVETNKDDCDRMATGLTSFAQTKGKEVQGLKRKLARTPEDKAALNARLDAQFGPRRRATKAKMVGGAKCMLSSDAVGHAMLLLEGDGEGQPDRPPPPKPFTGAPVVFVVDMVGPKSVTVSAYNAGDKTFAGFDILIRYLDAAGKVVKPTGGLDRDFVNWSVAGSSYRVPSKQWRTFELDHLDTPAGAVTAEVLATSVRPLEGARIGEAAWRYDGSTFGKWPGLPK